MMLYQAQEEIRQLTNVDETTLNESASRDLDEIFGAIGYRQGFDEFIEDNPGSCRSNNGMDRRNI